MFTEPDKNDPINKRVQKVLENRFQNKETLEALTDLSTYFKENNLQNRKNLRSQIERRSLTLNEEFLSAFSEIKQAVDDICADIDCMSQKVENMKKEIRTTEGQTHDLIVKTNQLQEESLRLTAQQQIATKFLDRFQLKPDEHKALYDKQATVMPEFFDILTRVQQIHSDCRILMQSGYQTAALDIMEEMNVHLEAGLEKLYRFTQNHCRNLDTEAAPLVLKSMQYLQDRPVLFKYVIDEYSSHHSAVLVSRFINALTTGPKPIEAHAHDPKRYIGDIFAWLHQAIPTERDNIQLLVKQCDKIDTTDLIQSALANITDGICHPLKVRVETIIVNSGKDTILLYNIANLIRFYQNIINNVVKGGHLEACLEDLKNIGEAGYLNSITYHVKSQLVPAVSVPIQNDLSPPPNVGNLLSMLKDILSVASMVEEREKDITKIVSCVIDPLLHYVTETAAQLSPRDMSVYFLNCLYEMMSALTMFEYMNTRMERLQAQCDAQIDTLTSEYASSLVANLNLGTIYTVLQSNSSKIDINHLKVFMVSK